MTGFRVPPFQRQAFETLAAVDATAVQALAAKLESLDGDLSKTKVAGLAASGLDLPDDQAHRVIEAVLGIAGSVEWADISVRDLVEELSQDDALELEPDARGALVENMLLLAVVPQVSLLARAASLFAEDERSFCTSRTVSDIRPVFSSATETDVSGALIHHMLKLESHHDGKLESQYLTISREGLSQLRDVLDRAIEKHDSLRGVLKGAGITVLEIEEEH